MKKFISLVLALVMALSLTTMAWGATEMPAAQNGVINLTEDVILSAQWVVTEDTTLNLNGYTISNTADIWNSSTKAWSLISVQGGTLTINGEGTVKAKENDCYAVDVRNGAACVINGGEYIGNCSAVYVYEGTLTVNSGYFAVQQQSTSGNGYGEVLNCFDANYTVGTAKVIVNGGIYEGFNPTDAAEPAGAEQSYVAPGYEAAGVGANGEFIVGKDIEVDTDGNITGGTFTDDVSAYVADGNRLVNGAVVSVPANTTGVVGGYEGQFTFAGATRQAVTNLTKTPAVAPLDVDEDGYYNRPGDRLGSIEYYTLNLGGAVAQNYYRVNTVGEADLIIYVGDSKTPYMYLANEPAGGFTYITGATAFANFGKACGQFKWAAVDTTKTYYAYDGQVYVVDPTGAVNLMVNGVFTQATNVTANGTWVDHVPTYTQDKTGAVTAVKCANCPASAVIVANYATLPDAVKAAGAYFNVPGSATKMFYWVDGIVVDTETKVESAETFDAGIAMYVGMSVMAAAGSAVVLKKKD